MFQLEFIAKYLLPVCQGEKSKRMTVMSNRVVIRDNICKTPDSHQRLDSFSSHFIIYHIIINILKSVLSPQYCGSKERHGNKVLENRSYDKKLKKMWFLDKRLPSARPGNFWEEGEPRVYSRSSLELMGWRKLGGSAEH